MFPQFASTAASFTRASSLVLKAGTDAHLYDDPQDADIVQLLNSKFDAEKVEGLKRLLALISQGVDVSTFFPQVVKSVASLSLEIKKLVYIYLVHYAEKRPDEALLSINTFQRDLVDFNPLVRAWALRAMCGIRVHVVTPLMMMAIQKCAKDPSPYVRRCAANAIPNLYTLNKEQYVDTLEELIGMLLDDKSAGVLGAAACAFSIVCPERNDMVAPRFRELCSMLPDVEDWDQVILVDILLRYVVAVHGYPKESEKKEVVCEDKVPHAVKLLLRATLPLILSHNSAVVLAAVGAHWLLASSADLERIVKPLLFLLRSSSDTQYVVMHNLVTLIKEKPFLFEEYYEEFFIRSTDTHQIRGMKLEVLGMIAAESSISAILQELQAYVRDPDRDFAANAVSVIGKCAGRYPLIAPTCMEGLLALAYGGSKISANDQAARRPKEHAVVGPSKRSKNVQVQDGSPEDREAAVAMQAVLAIRSVASQHFKEVEKVLAQLIRDLDLIWVSGARAVVIWMVGEYSNVSSMVKGILPTILSYLAACFVNEETNSKLQILNSMAKVVVQSGTTLGMYLKTALLALVYVLDLGSCDVDYDVRDRAHMLKQLMHLHRSTIQPNGSTILPEAGTISMNEPKGVTRDISVMLPTYLLTFPKSTSLVLPSFPDRSFLLGSMSHAVNHRAPGYMPLPEPLSFKLFETQVDNAGENPSSTVVSIQEGSEEPGEDSDASESYSPNESMSGSGDDSGGFSNAGHADNSLALSDASEGGSVCSSEAGTHTRSCHNNLGGTTPVRPLISLSDDEVESNIFMGSRQEDAQQSSHTGLSLRSSEDFESWLGSHNPGTSCQLSQDPSMPSGYMALSMDSINKEPRKMTLLDFTNGEGLEVKYCFCFGPSPSYSKMVWVKLYFANRSFDVLSSIYIEDLEMDAAMTQSETKTDFVRHGSLVIASPEIEALEPRQVREFDLYVDFQQQLVPIKLAVRCNKKCFQVKMMPDIGAFLTPKKLSLEEFLARETKLVGMFESTCRCFVERPIRSGNREVLDADEEALALARLTAARILSQINVFLVTVTVPVFSGATSDDVWNVHLKFSGESLTASRLCLITITLEPHGDTESSSLEQVLVKVNCEDSVFGQNLLNRVQKAITDK